MEAVYRSASILPCHAFPEVISSVVDEIGVFLSECATCDSSNYANFSLRLDSIVRNLEDPANVVCRKP